MIYLCIKRKNINPNSALSGHIPYLSSHDKHALVILYNKANYLECLAGIQLHLVHQYMKYLLPVFPPPVTTQKNDHLLSNDWQAQNQKNLRQL